jgi:hypothetical protein
MEEREVSDLEDKAHEYKKIQKRRTDALKREIELKADILALMRKHKKKDYVRDGIEIHIEARDEVVHVKFHEEEAEEE